MRRTGWLFGIFCLLFACSNPIAPAIVAADSGSQDTADTKASDTAAIDAKAVDVDASAPQDTAPDTSAETADVAPDAGPTDCKAKGCADKAAVCTDDGTCCVPQCDGKCGGVADSCGGTCKAECAGECTPPSALSPTLYRAWSIGPLGSLPSGTGCAIGLGGNNDGTHVTDFSDAPNYAQGSTHALAFETDGLIAKATSFGLVVGDASGAGCAVGASGCTLKIWPSSFNPNGLPGVCPPRTLLEVDPQASVPTFRLPVKVDVPSYVPLFMFAGPVEQLAPWVRVSKVRALPVTTPQSGGGVFCGVVKRVDLESAIAKLNATQATAPNLSQLKAWWLDHDPTIDTDGNDEPDAWPFAFTLGVSPAGPQSAIGK